MLVRAPRSHARSITRSASEAVRIIRDGDRCAREQRVGNVLERIPPDLRHTLRRQTRHTPGEDTQTFAVPLVTSIEEELHAKTDTDRREASINSATHLLACGGQSRR